MDTRRRARIRRLLWNQQRQRCFYGGRQTLWNDATLEHVIPRCRGGTDHINNLAMACIRCNNAKSILDGKLKEELPMSEECKPTEQRSFNKSGSKYLREMRHLVDGRADVYAVLIAFGVTCPAKQHAIKKLLCSGIRGKGDCLQDLREARDAIDRAIQIAAPSSEVVEDIDQTITSVLRDYKRLKGPHLSVDGMDLIDRDIRFCRFADGPFVRGDLVEVIDKNSLHLLVCRFQHKQPTFVKCFKVETESFRPATAEDIIRQTTLQ